MRDHSPAPGAGEGGRGHPHAGDGVALREAGATRLGCSKTAEILEECRRRTEAV